MEVKKKASRACRHRGRCCALPWPTSARNENHNSDSKVPLWGLITAVTGRWYSHPELPQMLLFNQEWMNIVWDVLLIQCLAERHFDWLFNAGFKYSTHRRWFLLKVCSILVLKPNYFPCIICKFYTKMGNSKQDLTIFNDQILDFKASDQSSFCMFCWLVSENRKKSLCKPLSKISVLYFSFFLEIWSHLNHT